MRPVWLVTAVTACTFTDRRTVDVPVVAGGFGAELVAGDGGELRLDEASVTLADLRLEEPPDEDLVAAVLSGIVGAAWAHPGHDSPGAVAGELLGTFELDLLAPDAELGVAPCYEGAYATGRVHAVDASLAGVYTSADGAARPFHLSVDADQEVTGLPFAVRVDADAPPSAVVLRFDVVSALSQVDWGHPDTDGDGVLTEGDGEVVANTARFGVVSTPTWSLSLGWSEGEVP